MKVLLASALAAALAILAIVASARHERSPAGLASWRSVGGCGAAGGPASGAGGGIQWIGRQVTGGLVDAQLLNVQTHAQGSTFTTFSLRLGLELGARTDVALHVPIVHKSGEVAVLGLTREASLAGFGDLSLEVGRAFGRIGQHRAMLVGSLPTGSADAVRQGVVLPQHLQLGSGVLGVTGQYQHTRDQDWGLMVLGASASYAGWENEIGDYRAPSATAYGHAGYLLGPLVPSVGLTLFGKIQHDRERGAERPADSDPRFLVVPSLSCEWSTSWLALMPAATVGLSAGGVESVSFGLGIASSLF